VCCRLKEKLAQLLRFEAIRDQHFNHELRTKELELKLSDAKLRQQIEFAAAEHRKARGMCACVRVCGGLCVCVPCLETDVM
jgi:hypothetical protein